MSFGFSVGDFLAVLELANKVRKGFVGAPKEFKAISDNVRDLSIVLQDAEANTDKLAPAQLQEYQDTLSSCKSLLLEIDSVLRKYCTITEVGKIGVRRTLKRTWKRLKWEPEDVRDIRSQITVKIATLNSLNSHVLVTNVAKLVRHQEDSEFQSLLEWLSNASFVLQQNDLALHCQPGSRRWLFESPVYQDWVKQKDGLLFCPGNAGTGKTYTMAMVVESLRSSNDSDVLTVYVYCTYRNHTQTIEDLHRSLLRLVLEEAGPSDSEDTIQACIQHRLSRKPLSRHECLGLLQLQFSKIPKINLLVDALDELPSDVRRPFTVDLLKLIKAGNISLFLTSRDIPEIREPFQKCETYTSLEIRSSDEDIRSFLRDNLFQLPNFVIRSNVLQKEVIDAITHASSGMFLLAELHLKSLTTIISPGSLRGRLSDIAVKSNAYDQLYEDTVERIGFQGPQAQEIAMQTLLVLTCARYPLSSAELTHAISIADDSDAFNEDMVPDMADLIAACHGLVVVDNTSEIVRLVHKSAQEYFERTRSRWFPKANVAMAKLCLRYLELAEQGDVLTGDAERPPFFRYAKANWSYHSLEAENESSNTLANTLPSIEARELGAEHPEADQTSVSQLSLRQMTREVVDVHTTIVQACRAGHQAWVEQLLTVRNYDPNLQDKDWKFPSNDSLEPPEKLFHRLLIHQEQPDDVLLTIATEKGDYDMISMLLAHGANPNITNRHGDTPLKIAARKGSNQLVSLLLQNDLVQPDSTYHDRHRALLTSIEFGHEECFKILAEHQDHTFTDSDIRSTALWAAHFGRSKIVTELLKWPGVDTAWAGECLCQLPIVSAILKGHQDVALLLLPITAEYICSRCSLSVFHFAVQLGFDTLLARLLELKPLQANHWTSLPRCPDSQEVAVAPSPLLTAIALGNIAAVQSLLPHMPVNTDFNLAETRLCYDEFSFQRYWRSLYRAMEADSLEVMETLLGKDVIERDALNSEIHRRLLLPVASKNGRIFVRPHSLQRTQPEENGTDDVSAAMSNLNHHRNLLYINILASLICIEINSNGLLHQACATSIDMEYILEGGYADPDAIIRDATNVAIVAEMVKIPGVDVNLRDQNGNTPLHIAVKSCQRDVVRLLLDLADTDAAAEDQEGNSPLHLASKHMPAREFVHVGKDYDLSGAGIMASQNRMDWENLFVAQNRVHDESIFSMLLLDKRSKPGHRNHRGESAMFGAALTGTKAMLQVALSNAELLSDLGAVLYDGSSLISRAIQENPYPDAVELLRALYPVIPAELEDSERVGITHVDRSTLL